MTTTCFLGALHSNFIFMKVKRKWALSQVTFNFRFFFFFADGLETIKLLPTIVSFMFLQPKISLLHHSPHINLPIQILLQHFQSLVKMFCYFLCKLAATRAWCI